MVIVAGSSNEVRNLGRRGQAGIHKALLALQQRRAIDECFALGRMTRAFVLVGEDRTVAARQSLPPVLLAVRKPGEATIAGAALTASLKLSHRLPTLAT